MRSIYFNGFSQGLFRRDGAAFVFRKSPGKGAAAGKIGRAATDAEFDIELVRDETDMPGLMADWERLLSASPSPEKIYQCPAFFRYLRETADPLGEPCALLVARRRGDRTVIGIVPARLRRHPLQFRLGRTRCWTRDLPVVQLLGSVPMLPDHDGLLDAVVRRLLDHFPSARAVSLQALPAHLFGQFTRLAGMGACVIDGWRVCHTIALPATFEAYLQKLSAKKRYNVTRQVRLLATEGGPLAVTRIERAGQVPLLFDALRMLMPPPGLAAFPQQHLFERLAANGLLLSCVVTCGGEPVGAVVATSGSGKWLIHNIVSAKKYQHLSAGTSTLHLALEDMMRARACEEVDFGYGTPNRDFRSTHVHRMRGHVLLYRRAGLTPALLACHGLYGRLYAGVAGAIKRLNRRLSVWRARRADRNSML
jgi:hypothetical protein